MNNKQSSSDLCQKLKGAFDMVGVAKGRYKENGEPIKDNFFAAKGGKLSFGIGNGDTRLVLALKS